MDTGGRGAGAGLTEGGCTGIATIRDNELSKAQSESGSISSSPRHCCDDKVEVEDLGADDPGVCEGYARQPLSAQRVSMDDILGMLALRTDLRVGSEEKEEETGILDTK